MGDQRTHAVLRGNLSARSYLWTLQGQAPRGPPEITMKILHEVVDFHGKLPP